MPEIFSNPLTIILAAAVSLSVGALLFAAYTQWMKISESKNISEALNEILADDYEDDGVGPVQLDKWSAYWTKLYSGAGFDRDHPGFEAAALLLVGSLLGAGLLRQPILGLLCGVGVLAGFAFFLKKKADMSSATINDQLPGFLFALKANIQANKTPDQAIISVASSMPQPLRNEIEFCKTRLLAGQSFEEVMRELGKTTTSRELDDLSRYMTIAAKNGASLEGAIDTIQDIVKKKKEIADEKKRAVKATSFDLYTSIAAIPIAFVATYFMSAQAKEFWFTDIISWAALAIVILLYVAGVFLSRKAARSLDDKQR